MDAGQGSKVEPGRPLVHCPRCASRLMTATSSVACGAEVIVARRCPECGHRDSVVTTAVRAAVWYRQDARAIRGLKRLADSLRDARALAVVEPAADRGSSCR